MPRGSPAGLQQVQRMQGMEWGDGAGHDYHLWLDGDQLYTDANVVMNGPWFDVRRFGAVGDGVTDDVPAFLAAANAAAKGGTVLVPRPPVAYLFKQQLSLTRSHDWVRFVGHSPALSIAPTTGGASIIKRGFQGYAISTLALGTTFENISFDCQSPTYTGPMIDIQSPFDATLLTCGFYAIDTYAVTMANAAADVVGRVRILDCLFAGTGATTAAVLMPVGSAGTNTMMSNCQCAACGVADCSNAVDIMITGCEGTNIIFNSASTKVSFIGGRLALSGNTLTIDGHNSVIGGCTINGGNVVLAASTVNCVFAPAMLQPSFTLTDNNEGSNFVIQPFDTTHPVLYIPDGPVVLGRHFLATNATTGHLYIKTCQGTPTGTPDTHGSLLPMIYDQTNDKLYVWSSAHSAWKGIALV